MARPAPARVVILGGGFAGTYAAAYLSAADLPDGAADVTLISDKNYFTFTPLLAEVVAGSLGREEVTFAHRVFAAKRGYRFVEGCVRGIDTGSRRVETSTGRFEYDYLLIALGARPRYFGNDRIARDSLPFTSVSDAEAIRERVIRLAGRATREPDTERRREMLSFAVAGAGPAGVEVAAEISHLLRNVLPRYYDLAVNPRVAIFHSGDRILPGWNDELALRGVDILRDRGIEVHLETLVQEFSGRHVSATRNNRTIGDGVREATESISVPAENLIWTAGSAPDPSAWSGGDGAGGGLPRGASGHLLIDAQLRVEGHDDVFAAGDVARRIDGRTDRPYPPVAPIAISQGIRAASNIENAIAGRPAEAYQAHHAGSILSLGAGDALVDLLGWTVTGRLAWAIYRTTYLLKLVGLKNKLRAGMALGLQRLFEPDLTIR